MLATLKLYKCYRYTLICLSRNKGPFTIAAQAEATKYSFEYVAEIPYIRFFMGHVFSANQNLEQYLKFSRIKFSIFQSHTENIILDCLNL